jgi:hypothetical protein
MDNQEFKLRTELVRSELGNDELFQQIDTEARQDERVRAMIANIKDLRSKPHAQEAEARLVGVNLDLIDLARRELLVQHGVKIDIDEVGAKIEEQRVKKLSEIHESLSGKETDDELLNKLHLVDDQGRFGDDTLNSPLFRERTKMAFEVYRSAVNSFQVFVDYNQMHGVAAKNVGKADAMRRDAHNEVASMISDDLGLDFDTARRLAAKIRDSVMPESSETNTYARSIMRIGRRLTKRYGDDLEAVMSEELKPVLEQPSETGSGNS